MRKRVACAAIALLILALPLTGNAGYRRQMRLHTKTGRIYHPNTWDAEIIWRATFFSERFRDAFIKQHNKMLHLDRVNAERFEAEQMHRKHEGWDFFVSLYTKDKYKGFSHYDDSFWKIELETEDGQVHEPLYVEKIPITPYEERMFPHIDRWSHGYRVTFPKVPLGNRFKLSMKSVVGASTVEWKVR